MDNNKVLVKIYGQEHVISGEKPKEHMLKVADYVDGKMREIEKAARGMPATYLATLAAVNAADDYFTTLATIDDYKKKNDKLREDAEHYTKLWEEAKRNFVQYKEDIKDTGRQQESLQDEIEERDKEISRLKTQLGEVEGNFFDLQMENVQLKSEVQRYKKTTV